MEQDTMAETSAAWGHPSILDFFEKQRQTTKDIYPSEWFFIQKKLFSGMKVLDIGCAKGGMANVIAEHITPFDYVGIDINKQMIEGAKKRYPQHRFYHIDSDNYRFLNNEKFDLVLCLGILHLHETWRDTIKLAWAHTKGALILDLRETHLASIENKSIAYFTMDFNKSAPTPAAKGEATLPYNIINAGEALKIIYENCKEHKKIAHYGYTQTVSALSVTPIPEVIANVYCIER